MNGANSFKVYAISELVRSFSIKKIYPSIRDRREKEDAEKAKDIIDTTTFVELPDQLV